MKLPHHLASTLVLAALPTVAMAQSTQFMAQQGHVLGIPGQQLPFTGFTRSAPLAADFDGDGRIDVLRESGGTVQLFRNVGASNYTPQPSGITLAGTAFTNWREGDFDGDGDLDVLVVDTLGQTWWRNSGAGAFVVGPATVLGTLADWSSVDVGDIDGDGDADFVRANTDFIGADSVFVVRSNGAAGLAITTVATATFGALPAVHLADVDGDGDLDLVTGLVSVPGLGFDVFANDGSGNFTLLTRVLWPGFPVMIGSADLDGDGRRDLVGVRSFNGGMWVQNQGNGSFVIPSTQLPAFPLFGRTVDAGDYDRDGDVDLLFGGAGLVTLLLNQGAGTYIDATSSRWGGSGIADVNIRCMDVDGDGDLDACLAGRTGGPAVSTQIPDIMVNHTRQIDSSVQPVVGGLFALDLWTGPGFAPAAMQALVVAFGTAPAPFVVPGFEGLADLDPASAVLNQLLPNSPVGRSQAFLAVPNNQALIGTTLFFQLITVPGNPATLPSFSNVCVDTVR